MKDYVFCYYACHVVVVVVVVVVVFYKIIKISYLFVLCEEDDIMMFMHFMH
jgi:hypothetical protein